ncbi:hypothetical protein [Sphingomonas koreensis]
MATGEENWVNLLLASYDQCFQEKRHYDTLSWTIGGALTLLDVLLMTALLRLPVGIDKFLLAGIVLILSILWLSVYERNRFWGEVCNEKAREIEKALGADGLGHAYMRGAVRRHVVLANTELDGSALQHEGSAKEPRRERDYSRSIHISIRIIIFTPPVLAFLLAALGIVIATS